MFLKSQSLEIDGILIPSIQIKSKSVLALSWPSPLGGAAHKKLLSLISQTNNSPKLEIRVKPFIAEPFQSEIREKTILDLNISSEIKNLSWLNDLFSPIEEIKKKKIQELPLTQSLLATILYGCAKSKFIVTWFAGLDPKGEEILTKSVIKIAQKGFAILVIDFPLVNRDTNLEAKIKEINL